MNERHAILIEETHGSGLAADLAGDAGERVQLGFPSPSQRRTTLDWLGRGLRPGRPGRLALEYPLLFERGSGALPVTLFADGSPRAFCLLWPAHVRLQASRIAIGLVSLVYTDPEHRGRGYARRVVQAALDHAEALGLGLVLLWSDLERLYGGLGFDRGGRECLLVLDPTVIEAARHRLDAADEPTIAEPTIADWRAIERLRDDRTTQLEMDRGGLGRFAGVPDLAVRVARRDGEVVGFAMRGKGDDFQEVIHEWGGDLGAALACCRALTDETAPHRELFLLTDGDAREPLPWTLRSVGARRFQQPLAWMRIASPRALARDLANALGGPKRFEIRTVGESDGVRTFSLRSEHGHLLCSQQTLLDGFLGAPDVGTTRGALARIAPAIGPSVQDRMPLPFFLWGLESI